MNRQLVVFEGYDGAGKSSLIRNLAKSEPTIRIINRKCVEELTPIVSAIEDERWQLPHDAEMLMRVALETACQHLVRAALADGHVVMLDRGIASLASWIDYCELRADQFQALVDHCALAYKGAVLVICEADFDTCWSRVEAKPSHSKKERLGRTVNKCFFDHYVSNLERFANQHGVVVRVDTTTSLEAATLVARRALTSLGVVR